MAAPMTEIRRVGVLGCGLMGTGIAQVAAAAGYETLVRDVAPEIWSRARANIEIFCGITTLPTRRPSVGSAPAPRQCALAKTAHAAPLIFADPVP